MLVKVRFRTQPLLKSIDLKRRHGGLGDGLSPSQSFTHRREMNISFRNDDAISGTKAETVESARKQPTVGITAGYRPVRPQYVDPFAVGLPIGPSGEMKVLTHLSVIVK